MPTVLRASGRTFDPDAFCVETTLPVCRSVRQGESRFPLTNPNGPSNVESRLHINVSDADFYEFETQINDAIAFLALHRSEIERLVNYPGVERLTLDFGIERRDVALQSDRFPPELIRFAGQLGLGIELSQYPSSDQDGDSEGDGEGETPIDQTSNQQNV